jgi:hypothetical protein
MCWWADTTTGGCEPQLPVHRHDNLCNPSPQPVYPRIRGPNPAPHPATRTDSFTRRSTNLTPPGRGRSLPVAGAWLQGIVATPSLQRESRHPDTSGHIPRPTLARHRVVDRGSRHAATSRQNPRLEDPGRALRHDSTHPTPPTRRPRRRRRPADAADAADPADPPTPPTRRRRRPRRPADPQFQGPALKRDGSGPPGHHNAAICRGAGGEVPAGRRL